MDWNPHFRRFPEGGEEVRQGGDKKDIVCRAVGRTWAFGMNEMGAMGSFEQRRD